MGLLFLFISLHFQFSLRFHSRYISYQQLIIRLKIHKSNPLILLEQFIIYIYYD